ncbi:Helix-turn-helix domain protein [Thalassoglobus neptunius]|uniref:Helix-turn-helix domain protein n=1 Tax=Thalassoglobus neptunius TaxID=1938619 RepID=A0A5C5X5K6_9PLAN|nr:helix-turn-helix domain-containing protein [Thalassoglobus neptunius]TWT57909.1 Helix-turn-helix domain protein [Thalassoglobus neptunius]
MRDSLPKLLTISDVAEILVCSRRNVYGLIEKGELPYIQTGVSKGYRIDPEDLAAFIQTHKQQKEGAKPRALRPPLKHLKL